jgi:superfamily II DNA or RNA helicase
MEWPQYHSFNFDKAIALIFNKFKITEEQAKISMLKSIKFDSKKLEMRSYQKLIAEYLKGPYRGLLVYHKLGTGKTLTAVYALNILNMETLILLPAALRGAWLKKYIDKYAVNKKIKFLSYNSPNLMEQYEKINPLVKIDKNINNFDNKLIIIDESHEFFQNVVSGKAKQAIEIYKKLLNAKKTKFLFLTGTPIVGDPFEIVVCFILLRGHIKNKLILPKTREEFYKYFVNSEYTGIKNKEIFKERITGLVSYYEGFKDYKREILPESKKINVIETIMGDYQYSIYRSVKKKEEDIERKFKYLTKEFKVSEFKKPERASIGTYKMNSSKACNFTFPPKVEQIYKELLENNMNYGTISAKYNFKNVAWPKKIEVAYIKWLIMTNLYSFKDIWDMIKKLSKKIYKLVINVTKNNNKKFVYSRMKYLGIKIISELLKINGYEELKKSVNNKKKRFIVVDGDTKNKSELVDIFNEPKNLRGEYCQIILGTQVLSKGISLSCVKEIHILEPQWRYTTLKQVMGRAVRLFSHKLLPKSERFVENYIYLSITKQEESTDKFLYNKSQKKMKFNETFLHAIKESAIDCEINLEINQRDNKIICKKCDNPRWNTMIPIDYKDHISMGSICTYDFKKIKLKKYKENYMTDENDIVYEKINNDWVEIGYILDGDLILWS